MMLPLVPVPPRPEPARSAIVRSVHHHQYSVGTSYQDPQDAPRKAPPANPDEQLVEMIQLSASLPDPRRHGVFATLSDGSVMRLSSNYSKKEATAHAAIAKARHPEFAFFVDVTTPV